MSQKPKTNKTENKVRILYKKKLLVQQIFNIKNKKLSKNL